MNKESHDRVELNFINSNRMKKEDHGNNMSLSMLQYVFLLSLSLSLSLSLFSSFSYVLCVSLCLNRKPTQDDVDGRVLPVRTVGGWKRRGKNDKEWTLVVRGSGILLSQVEMSATQGLFDVTSSFNPTQPATPPRTPSIPCIGLKQSSLSLSSTLHSLSACLIFAAVFLHTHLCIYVHTYILIYIYIHTYTYVCIYVAMYIYCCCAVVCLAFISLLLLLPILM